MQSKLTKTILGAVIAIALAIAVSYGLIGQQTADEIQSKANQTLSTDQAAPSAAPQQPTPAPQYQTPQAPIQPGPTQQHPATVPRL